MKTIQTLADLGFLRDSRKFKMPRELYILSLLNCLMKKEEFSVKKERYINKSHISKEKSSKMAKKKNNTRVKIQLGLEFKTRNLETKH
jgi:hypothetical protein